MRQLDSKAVWMFFIQNLLIGLPFIIVPFVIVADEEFKAISEVTSGLSIVFSLASWIIAPIYIALSFIVAKLSYRFVWYELREEGFRKEHGIIWKTYVTIPYNRIQNVDIHRGIIARLLGLSDLEIQTAGASVVMRRRGVWGLGAEGALPGVSKEEAEKLRDELIARARKVPGQGL
ncbi:MAG: PH domain-containing protein [Parcubacteria group bacterium]|nr:PH domain-containing protein [Parcubacteria group bacterium]